MACVEDRTFICSEKEADAGPASNWVAPDGLDLSWADLDLLLTVDIQAWKLEAEHIPEFFRTFHQHLPAPLWQLHHDLIDRLG